MEVVEWYVPALDLTFNFANDRLNVWRGRETLDYTAPSASTRTKHLDRLQKIQVARNVKTGPSLSPELAAHLTALVTAQEALKSVRADGTTAFKASWTQPTS